MQILLCDKQLTSRASTIQQQQKKTNNLIRKKVKDLNRYSPKKLYLYKSQQVREKMLRWLNITNH